jgi:predicted permease
MSGLVRDIRYSLRGLARTPGVTIIALVTVALGVGVNTAMFTVVNGTLLRPLPYPSPAELVAPWPEKRWSVQMLEEVKERVTSYRALSAYTSASFMLLGDGPAEMLATGRVSATHFDVLGARPRLGAGFVAGDALGERGAVAVLSHGFWQRRYGGDPGVIGTEIRLAGGGQETRTIVGVMPADFQPLPEEAEVWVPIVTTAGQPGSYSPYGLNVIGRLRPGVSTAQASAELGGLVEEFTPMHPTQFRPVRYSPVDVVSLRESMIRDGRSGLLVLLGAVGFILLIACTNVANLLLARAQGRRRQVAVQMALGASRNRVVRQVLTESMVLGVMGGLVGMAAAFYALPLINSIASGPAGPMGMDGVVLAFALAISLLAGLIFGVIPAVRASASEPAEVMRSSAGRGQSQSRSAGRLNDGLVIAQVALSLVLLAGAGLMLKSVWRLARVDPGFTTENVLTVLMTIPPSRYDSAAVRDILRRRIEEEVGAVPGVVALGSVNDLPLDGGWSGTPYTVEGQEAGDDMLVVPTLNVTAGFFEALGIPVVHGRLFGPEDSGFDSAGEGEASLLVNDAFAHQHWPDGSAIGGRILSSQGEPMGTIVGVVRDIRQQRIAEPPAPQLYVSSTQVGWPMNVNLVVRGAAGFPPGEAVVRAIHSVEPDIAVRSVRTMPEVLHAGLSDQRLFARLLMGFAGLGLLLGMIGVYGVIAYAVSRRTGELGVRFALGASRRDILRNVMTRAMTPVAVGIGLGIVGALGLTRFLAGLVVDVHVADPLVLGTVAALLALAGAAAALVPAARASRVSPVRALQAE